MTISYSSAQEFLAQIFSSKRDSTENVSGSEKRRHHVIGGAFDRHFALKGFGSFVQSIEIPIDDPQSILDGSIPFHSLVLKPQSAAFDEEFEVLPFYVQDSSEMVLVVFTDTGTGTYVPVDPPLPEDGPGMWVLVIGFIGSTSQIELKQAHRVTDGTNILIPEVHLAELTGLSREIGSTVLPPSPETWSKCLPFARLTFSSVLTLSEATYDALLPQLPVGTLIAITE